MPIPRTTKTNIAETDGSLYFSHHLVLSLLVNLFEDLIKDDRRIRLFTVSFVLHTPREKREESKSDQTRWNDWGKAMRGETV